MRRSTIWTFALAAFGLATALILTSSASATEIVSGPIGERLDNYLTRIAPFGFSGALLVAHDGEIVINKGYGMAIRDQKLPNTSETVFSVGSITKQFTAAAIMTLQMRGKLKTSDLMSRYVPGVPPDKAGITLHQLLTHTSGLADAIGDDYVPLERDDFLKQILATPLRFPPGGEFAYSNCGYSVLAAIVEIVSGQSYEAYCREHLFGPSGMELTGYRLPDWSGHTVAHWYNGEEDNQQPLVKPYPYWNLLGNGGILSTTSDMYRWHQALLGNQILDAAAKQEMYTPELNDYGYGWDILDTDHGRVIRHNGGSDLGNSADFIRFIDSNTVIMLFCNQSYRRRGMIDAVGPHVEDLIFGGEVDTPPAISTADRSILESYAGHYAFPESGGVDISVYNGVLRLTALGQPAICALYDATDALAEYEHDNELGERIMAAAINEDFEPLDSTLNELERRRDAVHRMVSNGLADAKAAYGAVTGVESYGTFPTVLRDEPCALTHIVVHFEQGDAGVRLYWRDGKNIGVGPLPEPSRVQIPFLPSGSKELIGYDIPPGDVIRAGVERDTGDRVQALTFGTTPAVRATRDRR